MTVVAHRKTPITRIHTWTSAFIIFQSIMLEKWPNKGQELLKYMQSVRLAASRGQTGGWIQYDEQYRIRKSRCPNSSWGVIDMELWLLCVTTQSNVNQPTNNRFSTTEQSQRTQTLGNFPNYGFTGYKSNRRIPFCRAFNTGKCTFGKNCKYVHSCAKCEGNHPGSACRKYPY